MENKWTNFKRKILRKMYDQNYTNGAWRRKCNNELYKLFKQPNTFKSIKINSLRCLGHQKDGVKFTLKEINLLPAQRQ
jgi:hypothetical protein